MSIEPDLVVIGAGPAGANAALAADRHGVKTVLVDQVHDAGGQVYRPLPAACVANGELANDPDFAAGDELRRRLKSSSVHVAFRHTVWRISRDFEIEAHGPAGGVTWRPKAVVAATGAYERCIPFPGWTLPGVIGLAAATILLKSQQILPGHRVVVAGCGPLLAAVAASILKAGGHVAAVVDIASPAEWLTAIPALASRPDQLARGVRWLKAIRTAGVPILTGHTVVEAVGDETGLSRVVAKPANSHGVPRQDAAGRSFDADCLAIGHGLVPSTELTRSLRARHVWRPDHGGWVAECDEGYRTSVDRLYVCGDGAGLRGARPSSLQGQIAGLSVARDLGLISAMTYREETQRLQSELRVAVRFGAAMAHLMRLRPEMARAIAADTIVCRCEDITRSEIDAALETGAADINQLKSWTRAGMGPCQGRTCGETIAALAADRMGGMECVGMWTGRLPLRPIPMTAIIASYRYEDLVWGGNKAAIDDEGRPLRR
jgi:NADPH-dependent 2,4-dienoyl-CoA reductase/sulfur reductase-like enzyme